MFLSATVVCWADARVGVAGKLKLATKAEGNGGLTRRLRLLLVVNVKGKVGLIPNREEGAV